MSQRYYDTETGGDDEIVSVPSDQDKKKTPSKPATSYTSRSYPSPRIDSSGCCDTENKRCAWYTMVTVVFIVGIGVLAASLKKLDSTEVSTSTVLLLISILRFHVLPYTSMPYRHVSSAVSYGTVWSRVQYTQKDPRRSRQNGRTPCRTSRLSVCQVSIHLCRTFSAETTFDRRLVWTSSLLVSALIRIFLVEFSKLDGGLERSYMCLSRWIVGGV
jgi:hypothetical protein